MKVTVLYFAGARDVAGVAHEECALPVGVRSVGALVSWLFERHPGLEPYAKSLRIAQNESIVDAQSELCDGDTLAVLPPSSGG